LEEEDLPDTRGLAPGELPPLAEVVATGGEVNFTPLYRFCNQNR
jgi:hypothetical protein